MCFSVQDGVAYPPSLRNIFKEIHDDIGSPIPASGDLTRWARQGVLLLNATLTVRANLAGSHQKRGWETFTDAVISAVAKERKNIVYILWGSYAQQKAAMVDRSNNLVLESVHPSPLSASRGFFGCRRIHLGCSTPFSRSSCISAASAAGKSNDHNPSKKISCWDL